MKSSKNIFFLVAVLLACCVCLTAFGQNFEAYIKHGDSLLSKRDYVQAINSYSAAIELQPSSVMAYNKRGNAYLSNKQLDLCIQDHTTAIELDPKNAYAYGNRGVAYQRKAMLDAAIADYSMAIKYNPQNKWAFASRGQAYLDKNLPDLAIKDCSAAIEIDANYVFAYNNRGLAYQKKKDHNKAIEDFSSIIRMDPKNYWAYHNRGISYNNLNEYELSLADFSKAISIDANISSGYAWRGYVYGKINNFEAAVQNYSKAIELDPAPYVSFNNRGLYYNRLGEYEKAVADFESCLERKPDYGIAYINIISPLVRLNQMAKANGYYKRYVEKGLTSFLESPNYKFYQHYLKALDLVVNEKYEDAYKSLAKASEDYGEELNEQTKRSYIDIMFLEGYILEKYDMVADAKMVYEQSLVIDPNQPDLEVAIKKIEERESLAVKKDNVPPEISIITPTATSIDLGTGNGQVQLVGRAKDVSGISSVKINDVPVEKVEDDGLFLASLTLKQGENSLVISAEDLNGNKSEKKVIITGRADVQRGSTVVSGGNPNAAPIAGTPPRFHAILIAEESYDDPKIPDLQNPRKDAMELGRILQRQYNFSADDIDTVFDKSREDIMSAIVKRSSMLTENDNLIIFYAGHGFAEKDKFGDVDGYWIPTSARNGLTASYISTEDINKAIKRSAAKHILIIADACFSGALTRALPPDASKEVSRQYTIASRKVMASGNLEPVPDNSKFIFYLKKKLEENTEKYLTAKDLYDSFYKAVMSNSDTVPQYAAIKNVGDEGGEFVFVKKD